MDSAMRLKLARKLAAARGMKVSSNNQTEPQAKNQQLTVAKAPEEKCLVLSNAQERMWFLHQLDPSASAYNVCVLWQLSGSLHTAALHESCIQVVQRHSIFRVKYFSDPELGARQQVQTHFPPEWQEEDLQHLPPQRRQQKLQQIAQQASTEAFNLESRSTLRLVLVTMEADRHVLVMVGQHIVWDGPSFGIFSEELAAHYNALLTAEAVQQPPLPVQYTDFAHWHRQKWQGDSALRQEQIAFWKSELAPLPEPIDLPTDFPRPVQETEQGSWCTQNLEQTTTTKLLALAAEEQVTSFEVIISAIALLMTRLARVSEVTIGTVASHRNLPELEKLIGNFGNVVPLRIAVDNQWSFRTLLRHSANSCRRAFSHADLPFEILLEQLQIQRGQTRNPLLDTMLTFLSHGMSAPSMQGLEVSWSKHFNGTTQTDLSFDALLQDGSLQFQATWRTALYKPQTIPNHLARLIQLVEQCVQSPDSPLASLATTLPSEQYLSQWGQRQAVPAEAETLVDWFEQTVQQFPERSALTLLQPVEMRHGESYAHNLSFSALNQQANAISHWLIAQGIGPEDRVALVLPRRLEWFIAMLGVLKSGAAFVPVDPNYPQDYIRRVLTLATPALIISDSSTQSTLQAADVVQLNTRSTTFADLKSQILSNDQAQQNPLDRQRVKPLSRFSPACITFTSGSTGEPKGVVVPHAGLVNLLASHQRDLYRQAEEQIGKQQFKVGHAWSLAFDAAWQPGLWMFAGHQLYLFNTEMTQDPLALARHIALEKMDFIELTPSMLEEVLPWLQSGLEDTSGKPIAPHVPAILGFGGESVKQELWQRITQLPNTSGFNLYGPTEATVDAMIARARQDAKPNIGGPVAGAQIYVLDHCLQLAPFGVPGELAIAGQGLARGYLSRSDLTASKFIANPFGEPGSRLYLTGDRVRWLAEGELEYLGRIDEQVKIRGYRVEPLEVESHIEQLLQSPCAVVARDLGKGGMQLLCFIENQKFADIGEPQKLELIANFRSQCEQALPAHLLPSYFVLQPKLPRLPNGKINRRALRTPEKLTNTSARAARNPLEQQLCKLMCEVLDISSIGIDDGFFEMGGDSISVVKLVSRARRQGLHLTPKQIFNARCVANLAKEIAATEKNKPSLQHDNNETGNLPLTPLMQRYLNAGVPLSRFAQITSLDIPDGISVLQFQQLLTALVARHAMLRARLIKDSTGQLQLQIPETFTTTDYCHQQHYVLQRDGRYIATSNTGAQAPSMDAEQLSRKLCEQLDPSNGKMLASFLVKGAEGNQQAWLAINHLVVDASSWHIITEDLAILWQQLDHKQPLVLPAVTTSWKSWSQSVREWLPERLPHSGHLGTLQSINTKSWYLTQVNQQCPLSIVAQHTGLTVPSIIAALSCIAVVVSGLNSQHKSNDITLQLERHGREPIAPEQDLTRTIGWFAREVSVALNADFLDTTAPDSRQVLNLMRRWCSQIIQRDQGLGVAKSDQAPQGPAPDSHWQLGFNFLGDLSLAPATQMWSATPLMELLQAACSDHWPLLHNLDLSAYYCQQNKQKVLCFNAIAPANQVTQTALAQFFQVFEKLIADLTTHYTSIDKSQQLYAVTPLQANMLNHCQGEYDPWTTQMEVTLSKELQPELSERELRAAATELLNSHQALRAGFYQQNQTTFIVDKLEPVWQSKDLRHLDPSELQTQLSQYRQDWYSYKFDLARPPLLRFLSIRTSAQEWRVLLHCHHLLLDGWSVPRIMQQWLTNLDSSELPQPALAWSQYLHWLQRQDPVPGLHYWNNTLQGLEQASLLCPQRVERRPSQDQSRQISTGVHNALQQLANKSNISLAIIFQWAWARTLSEALAQQDVVFGLFDSGRSQGPEAIESLVGLVTQLVPMRIDTNSSKPVIQQLQHLQKAQFDWQALPPVAIENLEASHKLGQFFDTLLVIENALDGDGENNSAQIPGLLHTTWQDSVGQSAALFVYPGVNSTTIRLCFDPQAVAKTQTTSLLEHFEHQLQYLLELCQPPTSTNPKALPQATSDVAPLE